MREYARIRTSLWHSRRFMALPDDDARLFYLYLHTCPHCNSIGCFVLPIGYAMADLRWDQGRVQKAIDTLSEGYLIGFDKAESVVRLIGFLRQDPPTNPKHVLGILRNADPVPGCAEKNNALRELAETDQGQKVEEVHKAIDRVSEGYRNPTPTPTPTPSPISVPDGTPTPPSGGQLVAVEGGFPPLDRLPRSQSGRVHYPTQFEDFWTAYPTNAADTKAAAYKAWRSATRKRGVTPEVLLDGAQRYAADVESRGHDRPAHVQTWVNREGWTADYATGGLDFSKV